MSDETSNGGVEPGSSYTVAAQANFTVPDCSGGVYYHPAPYYFDYGWIDSSPVLHDSDPKVGEPRDSGGLDISGGNLGFTGTSVYVFSGSCGILFEDVSSNNRYGLSVP